MAIWNENTCKALADLDTDELRNLAYYVASETSGMEELYTYTLDEVIDLAIYDVDSAKELIIDFSRGVDPTAPWFIYNDTYGWMSLASDDALRAHILNNDEGIADFLIESAYLDFDEFDQRCMDYYVDFPTDFQDTELSEAVYMDLVFQAEA